MHKDFRVSVSVYFDVDVSAETKEDATDFVSKMTREVFKTNYNRAKCVQVTTDFGREV